ncbi:MAG: hypothetical protein AAF587_20770 [Bacteroidota bacterium]
MSKKRKYRIQLKSAAVVDPHVVFLMDFQEETGYSLPSSEPIKTLTVEMNITDTHQNETFCCTYTFEPASGNAIAVDDITFFEAFNESESSYRASIGSYFDIEITTTATDTEGEAADLYFNTNTVANTVSLHLEAQGTTVNPTQPPYSPNQLTGTSSCGCEETVTANVVKASKFATFITMIGAAFSQLFSS